MKRREMLFGCLAVVAVAGILLGAAAMGAFTSPTIDIGVVVSDLDKAAEFYTKALGMTELKPFDAPADVARDAGLTDNQPLHVRVFALEDSPRATRVKLMQVPAVKSAKADHAFIHSTLGFAYLTLHVADIDAAVEQAKKAGASVRAKGPVAFGGINLAIVPDPDGNLIELVGPKK